VNCEDRSLLSGIREKGVAVLQLRNTESHSTRLLFPIGPAANYLAASMAGVATSMNTLRIGRQSPRARPVAARSPGSARQTCFNKRWHRKVSSGRSVFKDVYDNLSAPNARKTVRTLDLSHPKRASCHRQRRSCAILVQRFDNPGLISALRPASKPVTPNQLLASQSLFAWSLGHNDLGVRLGVSRFRFSQGIGVLATIDRPACFFSV